MQRSKIVVTTMLALAVVVAPLSIVTNSAVASPAPSGNTVAVCACGKVFTPNEDTKYLTYDDKSYACCNDKCHAYASKNPAKTAKAATAQLAKAVASTQMPIQVANVIAVGTDGAKALCGCGGSAMIGKNTSYLKSGDKTYAACSKKCLAHMEEDVAKSTKMIEAKLAEYHEGHAH